MSKLDDIQKELQQMEDNFQRLQDSVAQLAKEQEQSKEAKAGDTQESLFAVAERKGTAYPLEGHVIGETDMDTKEAYLSLLLFTWSLLQPEAKDADAGLVAVARIRASLHVDTSLYNLFCHTKETASADLETWFQKVDRAGGKSAYLLDTLILCQEMKAENDDSYGKLSQLYLLMGCQESMLEETVDAAGLIYERKRCDYLQGEKNHKWKSFDGKVGECYLDLVGDLNTPGQVEPTSYYALWPERSEKVTGVSKYAPKVMLKIEVAEGAMVEKGQTLFTLYGASKELQGGTIDGHGRRVITYRTKASSAWEAIFRGVKYKDLLNEKLLDGYDIISVKSSMDGIVHWNPCVKRDPFWDVEQSDKPSSPGWRNWADRLYLQLLEEENWQRNKEMKRKNAMDLQKGCIFVSSTSMKPVTIGKKPICVVEKM